MTNYWVNLIILHSVFLGPDDSPNDLTFSDVDSSSMRVSWQPPHGRITSYRVIYSSPETGEREWTPAPSRNDNNVFLQQLRPGTEYIIRVIATMDRGATTELEGTHTTGETPSQKQKTRPSPIHLTVAWQQGTGISLWLYTLRWCRICILELFNFTMQQHLHHTLMSSYSGFF